MSTCLVSVLWLVTNKTFAKTQSIRDQKRKKTVWHSEKLPASYVQKLPQVTRKCFRVNKIVSFHFILFLSLCFILFLVSFRWIVVHKLCEQQFDSVFVEFVLSSAMHLDPRFKSWSSIIHWGKWYWSLRESRKRARKKMDGRKLFKSVDWIFSFKLN